MTDNLFKNVACFTDIHFGLKHNSRQHNQDCLDFLDWFIAEAKKRNSETCIMLGDWHHHRATINVSTLNYSMTALAKLSEAFDNMYFIVGNHDLYYKEKRELNSIPMADLYSNIHLIDEITVKDDVAIVPWLVGNEWTKVAKIESKYMFGHFEFPRFKMNAHVEMPDHGQLSADDFTHQDYIFSGHFHKRQQKGITHYIGNPFGHNFADVDDADRGGMFLEWGGEPEYMNWQGPRYIKMSLSKLLEDPDTHLLPKTFAKIELDVDLSYEDANFIRETLSENYDIRELNLIPRNESEHTEDEDQGDIKFVTVDQIVVDSIKTMDSESFDIGKLQQIYNDL